MTAEFTDDEPLRTTPKRGFRLGRRLGPAGFAPGGPTLRQLLGAPRASFSGSADLSPYVDKIRNQLQTSQCVGMAFARVIHVQAQVEKFGEANPGAMLYPSSQGIYALAREEERTDSETALADEGSVPGLAAEALSQDVGVPLERDMPIAEASINDPVDADVLARALAMRVTSIVSIDSTGADKLDDICRALDARRACAIGIVVGDNYESCASTAPVMAETGQIYGGHEIPLLGYRVVAGRRQFLSPGSWGTDWGFGGWAWLDEGVVLDGRTMEAWSPVVVPDFSLSSAMRSMLAGKAK